MCDCDFIIQGEEFGAHYDNCRTVWRKYNPGSLYPKNDDGTIQLTNKEVLKLDKDVLYHLGMATDTCDFPAMFGDVKFVCMGGTEHRMKEFAYYIRDILDLPRDELPNLTEHSLRYAMYKIGPVLSVNHGIGIPSMTVVYQEVIKLLYYAKAKNPIIFRIGTSGGLGFDPGSVVISSFAVNGVLEKTYDLPVMGVVKKLPALFDRRLAQEVHSMTRASDGFRSYVGGTFAADDFYRGQARTDGPFCSHSEAEKMVFLKKLMSLGVRNIEMEATAFAALSLEAGLRAADVCVTFVDRMAGDQVSSSKADHMEWQKRPMLIVGRYIQQYLRK